MGGGEMIELHDVSKAFDGRPVLRRINWRIEPGALWLVAGASGIGKTTLLRLVMGLETPDSGTVTGWEGIRFCPVFQEDRLVEHWDAVQNAALTCGDPAQAKEILHRLLPHDGLRQPVRTLSGGMRRRAALARALAAPGDVLVLDEPFAGLDEKNAAAAWKTVQDYRAGRTLLLVSHGREETFAGLKVLRL